MISEDVWNQMHGDISDNNVPYYFYQVDITRAGFIKFGSKDQHPMTQAMNYGREGFYGWIGTGGSVMQWNPHLKIGFSYIPVDLVKMDFSSFRSSQLQQKVVEIVKT